MAAGDQVFLRNVGIRGKHKIANRWSETIYTVVKQIKDSPVYVVPETGDGSERVLNRDLLLPCGFLPPTVGEVDRHRPEASQEPDCSIHISAREVRDDEEMLMPESEDEVEYYFPQSQCLDETVVNHGQQSRAKQNDPRLERGPAEPD